MIESLKIITFSILSVLLFQYQPLNFAYAQNLNCSSTANNHSGAFPEQILLTYGETKIISLLDYWKGINLTYSIDDQANIPPNTNVSLPAKIEVLKTGSFDHAIKNLSLGKIVDVYFDYRSVQTNSSNWANKSIIVLLTKIDHQYIITIGNLSALETMEGLLSANITVSSFNLKCFKTTFVYKNQYYVDCVGQEFSTSPWINFFILVDTTSGNISISYTVSGSSYPQEIMTLKREMKTVFGASGFCVLRYYRGFDLTLANPTILEVWNVSIPTQPSILNVYNGSELTYLNNISTVEASYYILYIATCDGSIYFIKDWAVKIAPGNLPAVVDSMSFPKILLRSSNLQSQFTGQSELIVDTLILIADNENTQYLTMIIQTLSTSQNYYGSTFENYFNIPLPAYSKSLVVDVTSIAQTQSFFALSYKVAASTSTISCYYTGIFEFTGPPNSCHSLFPFDEESKMDYTRFNPLGGNVYLALDRNNRYVAWDIFQPILSLVNITQSFELSLSVDGNISNITIIVQEPNSTAIETRPFTHSISRKGATAPFLLNSGFIGPGLRYNVNFSYPISHSIYSNHLVSTNWAPSLEKLLAFHDNYISRSGNAKLIFSNKNRNYIAYANLQSNSLYNITQISFFFTFELRLDFQQYFNLNGYDIMVTDYENTTNILLADLSFVIKNIKIYANMSLIDFQLQNCSNYQMSTLGDYFVMLCIKKGESETSIYNITFSQDPKEYNQSFHINYKNISFNSNFTPILVKMHTAYPYTMFVLCQHYVFILNYTILPNTSVYTSSSFPIPPVNDDNPAILQPYLNKIFVIYPKTSLILEYDISNTFQPYFRRNISLYNYDISIILKPFVQIGFAFSIQTEILYIVANNTANKTIEMLALAPESGNSYLLDNIFIAYDEELENNTIAIDCTTLNQDTLGDLVSVLFDQDIQFYEIYTSPLLNIGIPDVTNMSTSEMISLTITAYNPWSDSNVSTAFDLTIYDDEVLINQLEHNSLLFPFDSDSITFSVNDYFSGTIFGINNTSPSGLTFEPLVSPNTSRTYPFNSSIANFTVINAWITEDKIYLLGDGVLSIFSVLNGTATIFEYNNTDLTCDDIIVDSKDSFVNILCTFNSNGARGIISFFVDSIQGPICQATPVEDFKDIKSSPENLVTFLLTGVGQNASIVLVHNLDPQGCTLPGAFDNFQEWILPTNNPNLTTFDVLFSAGQSSENSVCQIFIINANYGLDILYFDVASNSETNQFINLEWSMSFNDLFGYYLLLPDDFAVLEISIVQKEKIHVESSYNVNLLIVSQNYHSVLLNFSIGSQEEDISISNSSRIFMLPQEYTVVDWAISDNYLTLLVLNTTDQNTGLYALLYNIFEDKNFYNDTIHPEDPNIYISTTWMYPIVSNYSNYQQQILTSQNLIFSYDCLENSSICSVVNSTNLYFADYFQQGVYTFNAMQNVTLRWDSSSSKQSSDEFYITMYNNLQTTRIHIPFLGAPTFLHSWWAIGIMALAFILFLLLVRYIYRKYKSKHAIVFSRKKQYDPLRILFDSKLQALNEGYDKDESILKGD